MEMYIKMQIIHKDIVSCSLNAVDVAAAVVRVWPLLSHIIKINVCAIVCDMMLHRTQLFLVMKLCNVRGGNVVIHKKK